VYAALWRRLPGNRLAKAAQAALLFLAVTAWLFLWVFPRLTPYLPYEDVTVVPSSTATTATGPRGRTP